jgi:hypothetical protein
VDVCRASATDCGRPAADHYCQAKYGRDWFAKSYTIDHDIGLQTPTMRLGDRTICDDWYCDGFATIACQTLGGGLVGAK